jgi:hypothetical protein
MSLHPQSDESRREFFRTATRCGLLGLLAIGGAILGHRAAAQTCTRKGICPGCGVFANCGLPAALSAKAAGVNPNERKGQAL